SKDAAATLVRLNRFWELNLSDYQLASLAQSLGSDVSFFLKGGTQLATGRGDRLESLTSPALALLLITPLVAVADKTRRLYRALEPADYSDGSRTCAIAESLRAGRPIHRRDLV